MNFQEIVDKRRSINFFDPEKEISEDLLSKIIELASKTPSGFNLQPWNLMVIKDPKSKKKLKALAWDQEKVVEAPVILMVLADKDGWKPGHATMEKNWKQMVACKIKTPDQRDWLLKATHSIYGWSPEASLVFAVKNASFFAMSLMYAATSLGIETHAIDGFDHEGVRKAFHIPDNYWLPLLLAVGYAIPDLKIIPPKWRKTKGEIVVSFD